MNRLHKFTTAYIACALWCGVSDEPNSDRTDLTREDIADTTLRVMTEDCRRFWEENEIDNLIPIGTEEQTGHDFWLSRNGHGSGFWDRDASVYGSKEIADNLHVLAKNFRSVSPIASIPYRWSEFELYIGDNGKVYHC